MTVAVVVNPWYNVFRKRNMMIIMFGLPLFMFSGFIEDFFKSANRGRKFEEERKKFLEQLDEEDRLYEIRIMEARKKLKPQDQ